MTESDQNEKNLNNEMFSKAVKAGKRTYFFDMKSTRSKDHYLVITESKKRFGEEGEKPFFEKHKIFLYKEDFDNFLNGLNEAIIHIKNSIDTHEKEGLVSIPQEKNSFSNLDFDDLGKEQ